MNEEITAVEDIFNTVVDFTVNYSFQVVGAVFILIAGALIANWVSKILLNVLKNKNLDITLSRFLVSMVKILILVFAIIIALGKFGITIAPFIAALGALAFGASFAIQGPLSNYGAGLTIIITRPFVVGNTITVAGVNGVVEEVRLAYTILTNEDGVKITIPNKHIVGEVLQNSMESKIVEGVIGISYDSDIDTTVRLIRETLDKFDAIVQEPKAQIGVKEFADSAINIGFRYWVPTLKYFQISYQVNIDVYKALTSAGITIPFPQRDLHIVSQPDPSDAQAPSLPS